MHLQQCSITTLVLAAMRRLQIAYSNYVQQSSLFFCVKFCPSLISCTKISHNYVTKHGQMCTDYIDLVYKHHCTEMLCDDDSSLTNIHGKSIQFKI